MQTQFQDGPFFQLNSINKSCLFAEVKINGVKVNVFYWHWLVFCQYFVIQNIWITWERTYTIGECIQYNDSGRWWNYQNLWKKLIVISARRHWLHSRFHNSRHTGIWFARNFRIWFFFFLENNDIAVHLAKSYLELIDKFVELYKVNNNIVSRIKISESLTILQNSTTTIIGKIDSFLTENAENMTFEPNNLDDVGVFIS